MTDSGRRARPGPWLTGMRAAVSKWAAAAQQEPSGSHELSGSRRLLGLFGAAGHRWMPWAQPGRWHELSSTMSSAPGSWAS